ncbi:MarR family transcriptional regulator [Actinomyces sp. F1_1611]
MMGTEETGHARLADQLCFSLYAASRAVMGAYREGLGQMGLTYPQYVTMLAIWEQEGRSVRELGEDLQLDSGTLSPMLRRLEQDGLIRKVRGGEDERTVRIYSTEAGWALESQVGQVRCQVEEATGFSQEEMIELRETLTQLRARIQAPD